MASGSKPGERRGGRQKGTPNKATADIKAAARKHGAACIIKLVDLTGSDSEDIQLRAINSLLDRGYGKPAQAMTGEGGEGPIRLVVESGVPRGD